MQTIRINQHSLFSNSLIVKESQRSTMSFELDGKTKQIESLNKEIAKAKVAAETETNQALTKLQDQLRAVQDELAQSHKNLAEQRTDFVSFSHQIFVEINQNELISIRFVLKAAAETETNQALTKLQKQLRAF